MIASSVRIIMYIVIIYTIHIIIYSIYVEKIIRVMGMEVKNQKVCVWCMRFFACTIKLLCTERYYTRFGS